MSAFSFTLSALFAVLLSGVVYYYLNKYDHVVIKTQSGALKGFKSFSRDGRSFSSFRSIPFAKPPIGNLRFEPPVEFEKWEGVRDALIQPPVCLQADPMWNQVFGQEDCLYLNVFTPNIPKSGGEKLLPVMLFIHPGYFMFGGSDIGNPVYFMDEDVVLVTTQYRLGVLGFLSSGDETISGNMGMKDQVQALKWIQANIKDFGGDPNTVTIFGESAGAASVHFHLFSPLSEGLFHRAISQSGSSLCPWAGLGRDTKAQARKLGESLKCPDLSSSQALATCLKSVDAKEIAETQVTIFEEFFGPPVGLYGPTLETETSNAFLTTHPRELYPQGKFSKVPYLTGANSEEGCWFSIGLLAEETFSHKFYNEWDNLAPRAFLYSHGADQDGSKTRAILHEYFGDHPKTFTRNDYQNLTAMFSDRYFLTCQGETARLHSKFGGQTYLYYLNRPNLNSLGILLAAAKGKLPLLPELLLLKFKYAIGLETTDYGVCHSEEIQYQFDVLPTYGIYKSSPHYDFSKDFIKLWVNFAKNGYPGKYRGTEWTASDPNRLPQYMNFGHPGGMIAEPFTARTEFWKNLQLIQN